MKKLTLFTLFFTVSTVLLSQSGGPVVKNIIDAPINYKQTIQKRSHIWIKGQWEIINNQYNWKEGYWAVKKPGFVFVDGYWKKHKNGWQWILGYWKEIDINKWISLNS